MAISKTYSSLFFQLILTVLVMKPSNAQLKEGYYSKTCPQAEDIVKSVIDIVMSEAPSLSGPLLRLHYHDCFVRGCEGSVLLNSETQQAEKDAYPNQSLRGFQTIDRVKSALEKVCPGVVSCADILALVARDVTVATNGPYWEVETGRRDGNISSKREAQLNLPSYHANISTLIAGFQARGLSIKDLVVLSGAHTIGTSHCYPFSNRIYNFTGKDTLNDVDPTLDSEYIPKLRSACKQGDQITLVEMDPGSVRTFDANYYTLITKRRGLFQSDVALFDNNETKAYVELQATTKGSSFFSDFSVSMVNMGRIGVLTGSAGEIRKVCSKIN